MTDWMIEYVYDDRSDERDRLRPEHRAHLASLAAAGSMPAYGRFDDEGPAGALLIGRAETVADVEAMLDGDPFWTAGLITERRIRRWPAVWA
ncbi:YciI family protein [Demequina sp. NBRC 110051]|uniref:YciI family protein n=1 Tax=Demequina sp. NBRC 110051 TaxID=1570340 RepID=UPI000A053A23|nr:YciI family protein [Demequina sp. NBRC 110051]